MPKRLLLQWQPSDDDDDENRLSTNLEYVVESELISDSPVFIPTIEESVGDSRVFIPTIEESVVADQMTTSETKLNGDEIKEEHAKKKIRYRRKNSKTNWVSEFTKMICNGKNEVATELIQQFFALNGNSETKMEADAMIRAFITKGAKEDMLRMVLKIGGDRYRRLRENRPVKEKGNSRNSNAVSHDIIEQLNRMVETISIEEGYSSCSHKRKLYFITDLNISSWQALYEQSYKPFEPQETIRKVGFTTFYNHMRAHHPNLRLNRLKEDFCDLCIPRKVESTNKAPSSEDS